MNLNIPLPKLNYDDFYKFVVSLGIVFVLVCFAMTTFIILYASPTDSSIKLKVSLWGYLILAGVAGFFIGWALKKWYWNQKRYDELLRKKIKKFREETVNEVLDQDYKLLQIKRLETDYNIKIKEWNKKNPKEKPLEELRWRGMPMIIKQIKNKDFYKKIVGDNNDTE